MTWLPALLGADGPAGRGHDAFGGRHAGAAKFLHDQRQGFNLHPENARSARQHYTIEYTPCQLIFHATS